LSTASVLSLLASRSNGIIGVEPTGQNLREAVLVNFRKQPGATALVNVLVEVGVVSLWDIVASEEERKAIRVAAEVTPGVRAVNDHLQIRTFAMA